MAKKARITVAKHAPQHDELLEYGNVTTITPDYVDSDTSDTEEIPPRDAFTELKWALGATSDGLTDHLEDIKNEALVVFRQSQYSFNLLRRLKMFGLLRQLNIDDVQNVPVEDLEKYKGKFANFSNDYDRLAIVLAIECGYDSAPYIADNLMDLPADMVCERLSEGTNQHLLKYMLDRIQHKPTHMCEKYVEMLAGLGLQNYKKAECSEHVGCVVVEETRARRSDRRRNIIT